MTPSATARGGRQATHSRASIIEALQRYAHLYGDDFTAAAFSPSTAKWADRPELIDIYYAGDPDGVGPWPSLNAIKSHFNGSFNEARVAAGLEPNRPGPAKRRRKTGLHRPIRNVSHVNATRTIFVDRVDKDTVGRLTRELMKVEAKLERAQEELRKRKTKRVVTTKTKVKTKTVRVTDDAAVARARARAEARVARAEQRVVEARAAVDASSKALTEARTAATRLASRLERSEATVSGLREERRGLKATAERAEDRAAAAASMLAAREEEIERLRADTRVVMKDAPEQEILDAARREADEARSAERDAELRAATAEREYMALAAAVSGEPRKLTKAEMAELQADGPAGPAVLADALKDLGLARRGNNPTRLFGALTKIASAAVTWRERL